jgi:hypothetical protein
MSTKCRFTGKVTMYSDREGFAGPKVVDLKFAAELLPGSKWTVDPADFGENGKVRIPDIEGPEGGLVDLVVRLAEDAEGTQVDGKVELKASFKFTFAVFLMSRLEVTLDAGHYTLVEVPNASVQGAAFDPQHARLRLAGAATFRNFPLDGNKCLVEIDGRFDPTPWPMA